MAIPDYQAVMLPLLQTLSDGNEYTIADVTEKIADVFALTEEEREELLPSGQSTVIRNRVGWAKTYLKKAGLIDQPKRGVVRISDEGRNLLARPRFAQP